jgi:hypothetical protein
VFGAVLGTRQRRANSIDVDELDGRSAGGLEFRGQGIERRDDRELAD